MPEHAGVPDRRASTGLAELDAVLGGLFWGDNVAWELDGVTAAPFYEAIVRLEDDFDDLAWLTLGADGEQIAAAFPYVEVVDASALPGPVELLRLVAKLYDPRRRVLLLFDPLDRMVEAWGPDLARRFFVRCCPMLLELDERNLMVVKAEGREPGARGSLMHWQRADGGVELSATGVGGQVAASLRALRRTRGINQHQLADLAAITPSAISQAERAERSLSLATLVRLAAALEMTVDDLLRGEDPAAYQIGRRTRDPRLEPEATEALLSGGDGRPSVDLIRLRPREYCAPPNPVEGHGVTAVCTGLVQVHIGEITPVIRHGEVLMSDAARVDGWQNLRDREALLFWIVTPATPPPPPGSDSLWGEMI